MKDTRAGGGAFSCNCLSINDLGVAVVRFHTGVYFFGWGESPLHAREITRALKIN